MSNANPQSSSILFTRFRWWLSYYMERRGWQNAVLARVLEEFGTPVTQAAIGQWRNEIARPSFEHIEHLAVAFEVDPIKFFRPIPENRLQ